MVYTRSSTRALQSKSALSTAQAARTLLSMKTSTEPTQTQFWASWATWYHTFVSEVLDELSRENRFMEAERRWTTFCAKEFRCDPAVVQAWLKYSDARIRLTVAGF